MARRTAGAVLCLLALAATACTGSDDPKTPAATVDKPPTTEPSTTTSEAQTPEEEVEAAYLKSWDIYSEAVRTLDSSHVAEIYAETALATVTSEVDELKRASTPVKVDVNHSYQVQIVGPDRAVVVDAYVNHSVFVDPVSGEPTESDPNKRLLDTYTLKKLEGTWKVVGISRQ
jgi:hypothetical protein